MIAPRADPYGRVYAYGSYCGCMAAKGAAGRTPCNPWDMRFPLCVGRMWDGTMFSSVCALPSPASAEGMLPFVVRLVHWYYDTVRLLLYPVLVHVVSQRARVLRLRRTEQSTRNLTWLLCCLPPLGTESASCSKRAFRSSIARPTDTSVYASSDTSRHRLQDSRPGWIRCSPFLSFRAYGPRKLMKITLR